MPRLYKPEVKREYGYGLFDGIEYHDAVMKEDRYGTWVKLKTFKDETARLRAEIERLKKQLRENK